MCGLHWSGVMEWRLGTLNAPGVTHDHHQTRTIKKKNKKKHNHWEGFPFLLLLLHCKWQSQYGEEEWGKRSTFTRGTFYSACVIDMKYFWHILIGGNIQLWTIWLSADESKSKSVTQWGSYHWWERGMVTGFSCRKPHTVYKLGTSMAMREECDQETFFFLAKMDFYHVQNIFMWSADLGSPFNYCFSPFSVHLSIWCTIQHPFFNNHGPLNPVKVQYCQYNKR